MYYDPLTVMLFCMWQTPWHGWKPWIFFVFTTTFPTRWRPCSLWLLLSMLGEIILSHNQGFQEGNTSIVPLSDVGGPFLAVLGSGINRRCVRVVDLRRSTKIQVLFASINFLDGILGILIARTHISVFMVQQLRYVRWDSKYESPQLIVAQQQGTRLTLSQARRFTQALIIQIRYGYATAGTLHGYPKYSTVE